jgi:hypothetical protein
MTYKHRVCIYKITIAAVAGVVTTIRIILVSWILSVLAAAIVGCLATVAVTSFLFSEMDRSKIAQAHIMRELAGSNAQLTDAKENFAKADSNLLRMEITVNEQGILITKQGKTIGQQCAAILKQKNQMP